MIIYVSYSMWSRIVGYKSEPYCRSLSPALHFSYKSTARQRYLTTNYITLLSSSWLQFDILVMCGQPFSSSRSVTLQYTRGSTSYSTLHYGCSMTGSPTCYPSKLALVFAVLSPYLLILPLGWSVDRLGTFLVTTAFGQESLSD